MKGKTSCTTSRLSTSSVAITLIQCTPFWVHKFVIPKALPKTLHFLQHDNASVRELSLIKNPYAIKHVWRPVISNVNSVLTIQILLACHRYTITFTKP